MLRGQQVHKRIPEQILSDSDPPGKGKAATTWYCYRGARHLVALSNDGEIRPIVDFR